LNHANCLRDVYREDKGQCETLPECLEHRGQVVSTAYLSIMSLDETPTPQTTNLGIEMMQHMCK
uniref:Uncharacterized protein n=1 Tax=Romanomermis culicivorax TaxID=13658 RepID=A0A915HFW6_ROMCU